MSNSLRDFVISYAFNVDDTSRARAESIAKAAEDRITASNAAALAKRVAQENRAQAERIAAAIKAGTELSQADRRFVAEQERRRNDAMADERKRAEEASKRNQDRLEHGYKQAEAQALRLTSLAIKTVAAFDLAKLVDRFTVGAFSKLDVASKQFERLNYAAQAMGSSAKGISAIAYAISQLGGNADAAQTSLDNFGSNLQKYKAFEDILTSMGIQTRDLNGHLKDSAVLFADYLQKLAAMPRAQREAVASNWGIDEGTVQAGVRPELRARIAEYNADQGAVGADSNSAAESGTAFAHAMRAVNNLIEQIKTKIADVLFRIITPQLDAVADWLRDNGKTVSDVISSLAGGVEKLAASLVKAISGNDNVKDAMTVVSQALIKFGSYIGSDDFQKDVKSFVADLGRLAKAIRWCLEKLGIIQGQASAPVVPNPTGSDDGVNEEGGGFGASLRNRRAHSAHGETDNSAIQGKLHDFQYGRGTGPAALRTDQQKANAAAIADELRKAGAPDEGVAAVLGSMQTESSFNPRAHNDVTGGHTGLWQWDARRWPKIRAWIEKQGGDPWNASWQTRAYIAEGRAKPGDAIYDNEGTSGGFRDVMESKGDLGKAVHGVQRSERFGRGEEGGRAAHAAKWLGGLPAVSAENAPASSAPPVPTAPPSSDSSVSEADYKAAQARMDAFDPTKPKTSAEIHQQNLDDALTGKYLAEQHDKLKREGKLPPPKTHYASPTDLNGNPIKPGPEVRGRARTIGDDDEYPTEVKPDGQGKPVKVEVTDSSAAKIGGHVGKALPGWTGKGSDGKPMRTTDYRDPKYAPAPFKSTYPAGQVPRSANPLADLHKSWFDYAEKHGKSLAHPGLSPTEAQRKMSTSSVRHGDRNFASNPTFNIHTSDVKSGMSAAQMVADRGNRDLIRNMQGMEA